MLRFALVAFGAMVISFLEGVVVAAWLVYAARQLYLLVCLLQKGRLSFFGAVKASNLVLLEPLKVPVCLFAGFLFSAPNAAYRRRGFKALCCLMTSLFLADCFLLISGAAGT